jgi:glycosyltransferase involved in cell wall biosynthesis
VFGLPFFPLGPSAVLQPRHHSKSQDVSNAGPVFLTTSSPSFCKGFEMVIEMARILTGNGLAFTWLVAGLKEGDALVKLVREDRKARDLGALNIHLLGTLGEEALAGHLLTADFYVQGSHIENSPNSLCETMLAGVPVIASYAGGTASLLRDGVHGVLVQDGDPYVLAGASQEAVADPERARSMAVEARRVASERHDPATIVMGMLERYGEIIEAHAGKERRGKAGRESESGKKAEKLLSSPTVRRLFHLLDSARLHGRLAWGGYYKFFARCRGSSSWARAK